MRAEAILLYSIKAARLRTIISVMYDLTSCGSAYNSTNRIGTKCRSIFHRSFCCTRGSIGLNELVELEGWSLRGRASANQTFSGSVDTMVSGTSRW